MCLDVCPAAEDSREDVESAVNRTTLWGKACQEAWANSTGPEEGRNLLELFRVVGLRIYEKNLPMNWSLWIFLAMQLVV